MLEQVQLRDLPPSSIPARVIRAPERGRWLLTVLSTCLEGCFSHWCGNHTQACYCSEGERNLYPPIHVHRWKGFLHVMADSTGKQFFLELSLDAARSLLSRLDAKTPLRGLRVAVRREPETKRGSIILDIVSRVTHPDDMPMSVSVGNTLRKLWKCRQLPSGQWAR
jgi:hypothetical protein